MKLNKDLRKRYFVVHNDFENRMVQRKLMRLGYSWMGGSKKISIYDKTKYIGVELKRFFWRNSSPKSEGYSLCSFDDFISERDIELAKKEENIDKL